jgi:adenylate kinase
LTIDIIKDRLDNEDCINGFLLDGYPRTVYQAEVLETLLEEKGEGIDTALLIKVPREFILKRMTGRRVCLTCGASYHVIFNPPEMVGKCNLCGSDLMQRADDSEDTVNERLDIYDAQTEPLIKYYSDKNLLSVVDGTQAINSVFESICSILGEIEK